MGNDSPTIPSFGSRMPGSTSSSLLAQAKAREPLAWQRLVNLYTQSLYRWCRQAGLTGDDTADVVQDVFASVACHLDDFRGVGHHGSFRAWLRQIAHNRIVDHFRQLQTQPLGSQAGDIAQCVEPTLSSEVAAQDEPPEAADAVWRRGLELVRAEFEERTWQAFWRVTVDSRSPADVAQELGMTVAAVHQAKYRVLRRLRQQLGDLEQG